MFFLLQLHGKDTQGADLCIWYMAHNASKRHAAGAEAGAQMVPSCSVAKERSRIGVVANVVLQLVAQARLLLNAQELRTIQAPVCWRLAVRHNQELHAG